MQLLPLFACALCLLVCLRFHVCVSACDCWLCVCMLACYMSMAVECVCVCLWLSHVNFVENSCSKSGKFVIGFFCFFSDPCRRIELTLQMRSVSRAFYILHVCVSAGRMCRCLLAIACVCVCLLVCWSNV